MKKILVVLACLMAGAILFFPVAPSADEFCVPTGSITLEPLQGAEAKRAAVEFPHSQHFDLNCKQCHHKWKGEEAIQGCMTTGCHDAATSQRAENPKDAWKYYKNAYHKSCIGCHKATKAENRKLELAQTLKTAQAKTGPTGCKACHPKGE
jgi:Class III cytochrome C family